MNLQFTAINITVIFFYIILFKPWRQGTCDLMYIMFIPLKPVSFQMDHFVR